MRSNASLKGGGLEGSPAARNPNQNLYKNPELSFGYKFSLGCSFGCRGQRPIPKKSLPKSNELLRIFVRIFVWDYLPNKKSLTKILTKLRSNFRANERRGSLLTFPNAAESQEHLTPCLREEF